MTDEPSPPPVENDEGFAKLFDHADPRPAPSREARQRAYSRLEAEWQSLTARRGRGRRMLDWGLAASLLVAIAGLIVYDFGEAPSPAPPVAAVVRSMGDDVRWTGKGSPARPLTAEVTWLAPGESVSTGPDSRLALGWHSGGSLRVDENTRLEFVSPAIVRLIAGRLYFDSVAEPGRSPGPPLSIDTPAGRVTHLGTQFMTRVSDGALWLAVREGAVRLDDGRFELRVEAGRQLEIDRGGVQSSHPMAAYGDAWQWVEEIAPMLPLDGRSAREMLDWVARETGRTVVYQSAAAEAFADDVVLHGLANVTSMQALRALPHTTDLRYELVEEQIRVRLVGPADQGRP